MKSDNPRDIFADRGEEPRETRYETEILLKNKGENPRERIENFEMFASDSPPVLPDEGETIQFEWIEDIDGNEITEPVDPEDIGTDRPYTQKFSRRFTVISKKKSYSKDQIITEGGETKRILTVSQTLTISLDE